MDLNSKYFDRIRISPGEATVEDPEQPPATSQGCGRMGGYRAPKGRGHEGEYFNFCLDHVREYNKSYNYFAGMADDEIVDYQRSASTGHRPTWNMGVNRPGAGRATRASPGRRPLPIRSAFSAARRPATSRKKSPSAGRCAISNAAPSPPSTSRATKPAMKSRPATRPW